jgi:hypothetical protein
MASLLIEHQADPNHKAKVRQMKIDGHWNLCSH